MSETIDTIKSLGDLMLKLQQDESIRQQWSQDFKSQVEALELKYAELKEKAKSDANAKNAMNAIAKGIPIFSKGVISAVQGFQKNDPLSGSAGVIDAVSSIITTVSAMSSSAGPPGAILGAILSVISMILKLFAAQKPSKSIAQQLMEVIRKYDAEKTIQELKAVQHLIENYIETTGPSLFQTYASAESAVNYYDHEVPNARQRITDAAEWLKESKNQELELWSAVLAAQCFAYIAHTQSMLVTMNLIETDKEQETFRARYLPVMSGLQLRFLKEILPAIRNKGTIWQCTKGGYLYKRGVVVSHEKVKAEWISSAAAEGHLRTMDAFTVVNRPSRANQVTSSPYPSVAQFSVESAYPRIQLLPSLLDGSIPSDSASGKELLKYHFRGRFGHAPFRKKYGIEPQPMVDNSTKRWSDFPPMYGVDALPSKRAHQVMVYTSHGSQLTFWEHGQEQHSEHEDEQLKYMGYFPMKDGFLMGQVSATYPKQNPKETGAPEFFNDHDMSVVYGACGVQAGKSNMVNHQINISAAHMEIKAYFMDHRFPNNPFRPFHQGAFTSPWPDFVGITTDPYYVWVYRAGAIACATHNDILTCLQSGQSMPKWMIYQIPHEGISDKPYDPEVPGKVGETEVPRGLIDLASCVDGSLTAAFTDDFVFNDRSIRTKLYAMTPEIDLQARTLQIVKGVKKDNMEHKIPTPGWAKDDTAESVYRIAKQPIYCWEIIDALMRSLEVTNAAHS